MTETTARTYHTMESLRQMAQTDLRNVNRKELVDINEVEIRKDLSQRERMVDFISQIKNPYCYLDKGMVVKISFAGENRLEDLCDDVVSREEYGEMNTRFAQKIKEAQDKIQEIREKKQEALKHDTLLPTWLEEFKQHEHIKTLERRVVVELIDHIDVHSKTEIEIHFCFEDELHSITEKFMEYQAHHGNEVAEE